MSAGVKKKIRIMVVDDHFAIRMGLTGSINLEPDMAVEAAKIALAQRGIEAAELDAVALFESALHFFKHGFDGHLRFGLRDAGLIHDLVNDIELDQKASGCSNR